jgi:hypothetical protein
MDILKLIIALEPVLCPWASTEPGNYLITTFDSGDEYDK